MDVDPDADETFTPNPNSKPKIVLIMGATGSGKSKLAIDLASHFPIEIINADSMQVFQGLDVLTNKIPVQERNGVPHHLLGTISPDIEFTAKEFREHAIPLIDEIWLRNCLPVIVGGTNYYIQALVSQYLLNDFADDLEANCSLDLPGSQYLFAAEILQNQIVSLNPRVQLVIILTPVLKILTQFQRTESIQMITGRSGNT